MTERDADDLRDVGGITHLNQVELARRWRLSPRTLERWRFLGLGVRHLKIGGRVIYRLTDVEAYETERERPNEVKTKAGLSRGADS